MLQTRQTSGEPGSSQVQAKPQLFQRFSIAWSLHVQAERIDSRPSATPSPEELRRCSPNHALMSEVRRADRDSGLSFARRRNQAGLSYFIEQFSRARMKVHRTEQCYDLHGRKC